MIDSRSARFGGLVLAVLAMAGPVSAQQEQQNPPARPYRGLFGRRGAPTPTHTVAAALSVAEVLEENATLRDSSTPLIPSELLAAGGFSGRQTLVVGGLSYAWTGRGTRVTVLAASNARRYRDTQRIVAGGHVGSVTLATTVWGRTQLFANAAMFYTPAYVYGVFPVATSALPVDGLEPEGGNSAARAEPFRYQTSGGTYTLGGMDIYTYQASVGAVRRLGRASSVELTASGSLTDFPETVTKTNRPGSALVGARYVRTLTASASLNLGYAYHQVVYPLPGVDGVFIAHDVDIGVNYNKALSPSRRTRIGFGVGSTALSTPATSTGRSLVYMGVGTLRLEHEIGRSWRAVATYNRGFGFAQGFRGPVFSDTVDATATGSVGSRVNLAFAGTFSRGSITQVPGYAFISAASSRRLDSQAASARLSFALTRNLAAYAEYVRYWYEAGSDVLVSSGVPPRLDGQSARVGLTLWVPLWSR